MSLFSDNIRYLRVEKKLSQDALAANIGIKRTRYVKYEDGSTEAPYDILLALARFYHISVDLLLTTDIRRIDIDKLLKLDDNRLLLPITVDPAGKDLVEVVPLKAKAGYVAGYADPVFIESLPQISLPMLGPGKHRAFPITGDSMPPYDESTYVVGRYIENIRDITVGKTYIILTANDGIVYKRLAEKDKTALTLSSDNTVYEPYEIRLADILEIWEFSCSLNMAEAGDQRNQRAETVEDMVKEIRRELLVIKQKLS